MEPQTATVLSGRPPRSRYHPNLVRLRAFSFLQMTLFPMAIITIFWKDRIGLTLTQILLLQSILSVVMVAMEYPTGYISDRIGYRFALNIAALSGMAGWGLYTVAGSFSQVLAAEVLLGISLAFISGSDSALLYETLKAQGEEQGYPREQGMMSGFAQAGEAIGALCAGTLYAWAPLLPFFLQIGVWFCAFLITRSLVEPPREPARPSGHLAEALRTARFAFLENRQLRATVLLNTLLGLASFYPVWLIQPYMQSSGVPLGWFGPVWTVANLTVATCAVASHRLTSSLGARRTVILCMLLVGGGYWGLGTSSVMGGFAWYYLLTSMRGLRGPFLLSHAQRETPSSNRAGILSLQSLAFRLMFAVTGPLVGVVADAVGVRKTFVFLFYFFLVLLPPFSFIFLRSLGAAGSQDRKQIFRS